MSAEPSQPHAWRLPWKAVMAAGVVAALLIVVGDAVLPEPRLFMDDLILLARGPRPLCPEVAIVDLEDWPRPRTFLARLVDTLDTLGPSVIALDVLLDVERPGQGTERLAAAIARSGRVVLPLDVEDPVPGSPPTPLLAEMDKAASGSGVANFFIDPDRVVRRVPTVYPPSAAGVRGRYWPAFATAVLLAHRKSSGQRPAKEPAMGLEDLYVDWAEVTRPGLDVARGQKLLDDPAYLDALVKMGFFRGRILFVGYVGSRYVGDGFITPFSTSSAARVPGVVVHANVASNLLEGRSLQPVAGATAFTLALMAALLGGLWARRGLSPGSVAGVGFLCAAALAAQYWGLVARGVVLPGSVTGGSLVLGFGTCGLLQAAYLRRWPLVQRLYTLLGPSPASDIVILNVTSGEVEGGRLHPYRFQLRRGDGPGAVVATYPSLPLGTAYRRLCSNLGSFLWKIGESPPADELAELGEDLTSVLLCPGLERDLASLEAGHLHLELEEQDLPFPWELAVIDGKPLSSRFTTSRSIVHQGTLREPPSPPLRERGLTILIVANPWPLPEGWPPLESAEAEAEAIATALSSLASRLTFQLRVEVLKNVDATRGAVERRLVGGGVDLLHYSGHAVFEAGTSTDAGFVFPEGPLSCGRLREILGPRNLPPVVFANACGTGQNPGAAVFRSATEQGAGPGGRATFDLGARLSMPVLFTTAGVRLFVGCLWLVETRAAARCAVTFYTRLLEGAAAGAALARARSEASDFWMTQAAYVMYGDPRLRLVNAVQERASAR